jgi:hypothetical protein
MSALGTQQSTTNDRNPATQFNKANVVSPIPALVPSQKIVPRPDQQPCLKEIPDAT